MTTESFARKYVRQWPLWGPLLAVLALTAVVYFVFGKDIATMFSWIGTVTALLLAMLIGPRR